MNGTYFAIAPGGSGLNKDDGKQLVGRCRLQYLSLNFRVERPSNKYWLAFRQSKSHNTEPANLDLAPPAQRVRGPLTMFTQI